jgi:CspA family cold shock protein
MFMKCIKQWFKRLFSSSAPRSGARLSGVIKFFDRKKRFGFIVAGKHEYFFHAAATKPKDFKCLKDGAKVQFKVIQGKKGPQADKIEVIQ